MDVLEETKLEQAIRNTIEGLQRAEEKNKLCFSDWPKNQKTDYEIQPKRRDNGGS